MGQMSNQVRNAANELHAIATSLGKPIDRVRLRDSAMQVLKVVDALDRGTCEVALCRGCGRPTAYPTDQAPCCRTCLERSHQ